MSNERTANELLLDSVTPAPIVVTDPHRHQGPPGVDPQKLPNRQGPRLSHGGTIMIPEGIVASEHTEYVPSPLNLDPSGQPATVFAAITGDAFSISGGGQVEVPSLFDSLNAQSTITTIPVTFKPRSSGRVTGTLTLKAKWPDGHEETLHVAVVSSARSMGEERDASKEAPPEAARKQREDAMTLEDFDTKSKHLDNHVVRLAQEQIAGLDVIAEEAKKFVPSPPPESIWQHLAELAVTLGTAGMAAVVGKFVAGKLVGLLSKSATAGEKAVAGHIATQAADHASGSAHGAAEAVVHAAEEHGSEKSHYALEGLATMIEDGIKDSVAGRMKKTEESGEASEGAEGRREISADPHVQFFTTQAATLHDSQLGRADMLADAISVIRKVAVSEPARAIRVLDAIQQSYDVGAKQAAKIQADATATQWVSYVAQGKLGAETVGAKDHERDVTRMDALRKNRPGYGPTPELAAAPVAGVLDIEVYIGTDRRVQEVKSARLDGVSQLIGDRLLKMDLRHAKIPVRIRYGVADVITVDEAGRVRTVSQHGIDADTFGEDREVQKIRGAQRAVDELFAKTLASWGIVHVATDDKARAG